MKLAALSIFAAACSQHLYSPPTQAYQLAPVTALDQGQRSVDLDVSTHSQIFDPGFDAGTARLRTGIGDDTEVSVEGMGAFINSNGTSTANRQIYAGRGGVRISPDHGPVAFDFGLGGGYAPAGGGFAALDAGVSVGYANCYVEPIGSLSVFASQPFDAKAIDVTTDPDHPMTSTPSRTAGATIRGGLRFSLSPARCHRGEQVPWLTAGIDVTGVADASDHANLMGVGAGVTFPL